MTDREKLIDLMCHIPGAEEIADFFIANGVTFQRWIPVTERLPEEDGRYLVCREFGNEHHIGVYGFAKDARSVNQYFFSDDWENVWYGWDEIDGYFFCEYATHWMPLPEPPGEERSING